MKIFTIIVTYNAMRNEWIYKCLDSLLSSDLNTEIIVIDNASTDETCQVIKDRYPTIILIENSENQGFEKALELGCEYLFLLNQDAWVEKGCIEKLVNCCIENPDFGIISPIHLNGKGDALDYNFSLCLAPEFCKGFYSDAVLGKFKKNLYSLPFVNAAAWLLSKETLKNVGGFNPSFYHYAEDDNFCQRTLYHNFKIGILNETFIYHDREERSSVVDISKIKERRLILHYSNPQKEINLRKELKRIKVSFLKNKIMGRHQNVLDDKAKRNYLNLNFENILKNLEISKSQQEFKFLKKSNE